MKIKGAQDMVESMRPGSVIVDLAAESGGNCETTVPGKVADHNVRRTSDSIISKILDLNKNFEYFGRQLRDDRPRKGRRTQRALHPIIRIEDKFRVKKGLLHQIHVVQIT